MTALEVYFDEWKWKEGVQKLTNEHFALGIIGIIIFEVCTKLILGFIFLGLGYISSIISFIAEKITGKI